jgi:hypothetical protein
MLLKNVFSRSDRVNTNICKWDNYNNKVIYFQINNLKTRNPAKSARTHDLPRQQQMQLKISRALPE